MSIVEYIGDSSPRGIIKHWERKTKSECAYEIERCYRRIRELEKRQLPQDVEEFIVEYETDETQEWSGGEKMPSKSISPDDLRAWMAGHVRVPVEFVDDAMCRTCYTHAAYMTKPCQWCRDREAMLNESKGK